MSPGTEQQDSLAFTLPLVVLVATTTPRSTQRDRMPRLLFPLLYDAGARPLSLRAGFSRESAPAKYIWPPCGPAVREYQRHLWTTNLS
ncbi:hypothetical protein BP00DRAFT_425830 [Aspergillus indologenus CBS 114.80]|uniref:Uncharacterized protein n=1 Tax=Aspergillus indologenus CBS 114.80 TaxID=1450541 RepID=A0A2V5IAF8_9EURO|nr:hypothetical protein BP00DRAFT_425830 [Aspergillus indologenus CBS 114.80]